MWVPGRGGDTGTGTVFQGEVSHLKLGAAVLSVFTLLIRFQPKHILSSLLTPGGQGPRLARKQVGTFSLVLT